MMVTETSLGRWLQRRRKALDLTQEKLAGRVGCATETLRKIEADVRRPSRQMAERLAEALEIPVPERAAFIKVARAELAVDHLASPTQYISQLPIVPTEELPSGTITFLFTEIEAGTGLGEQHPTTMPGALTHHNSILREAVTEFGGVIFKTSSSGICAAFSRARNALDAAVIAQQRLNKKTGEPLAGHKVRMALHTGSADTGQGQYRGRPLNRLACLLAVAHGNQILLSRATQQLVRDELSPEIQLLELGEYRLKDLFRPEYIFQAVAPNLPVKFPPLINLDVCPNNLPVQPTPLVDRDSDVMHICDLLQHPQTRLLTLIGPGGVGKTRLALQAAVELLDAYPHGVYFVSLASINDVTLVAPTIAQVLGVQEPRGRRLIDALKDYLHAKYLLLLLDNFEHLIEAAPLISELLASVPQLRVLVTSRAVLRLRGEKEFPVPPLDLPDSQHTTSPSTMSQCAAVQLFIERAKDINPNIIFTEDKLRTVATICVKLDGLPLAIELAAARMKLFSLEALLARLQQRLALLTGGARDLPARQQTLRATIEWSYQLLEPIEQVLFRRLSVFSGGCTIAAATAVCNSTDDPNMDVLNILVALVDKSLLRKTETADKEPRFEMLETIREYALEQLAMDKDKTTIEHLYVDFFLVMAEEAEPQLTGPRQRTWLERLEADNQNLRSCLGRTLEWREAELALRLSGALWQFWELRGYVEEGRTWLNGALAIPEIKLSHSMQVSRATALYRAGFLANYQGDYIQAAKLCEESLSLFQRLGDATGIAWAKYVLGSVWLFHYDHARAAMLLEESLLLFRELGDKRGAGWALNDLGLAALERGDHAKATTFLEESLTLFRELGDIRNVATSFGNLGNLAQELGNDAEAEARFITALESLQQAGDKGTAPVSCLLNLGELALARDDMERAKVLLEEGIELARNMGVRPLIAFGLVVLAWMFAKKERYEHAAQLLGAAAAQHDIMTTQINQSDRITYEQYLAVIKTQLGQARFAAIWTAGQSMPLDRVLTDTVEKNNSATSDASG